MMKRIAAFLLAVILIGCASSAVIYLQNTAGEMARCGPYPDSAATNMPVSSRTQLDHCVADYQSKGYRTVPSPNRIPGPAVGF